MKGSPSRDPAKDAFPENEPYYNPIIGLFLHCREFFLNRILDSKRQAKMTDVPFLLVNLVSWHAYVCVCVVMIKTQNCQ